MNVNRKRRALIIAGLLLAVLGAVTFAVIRHYRSASLDEFLSHQANHYLQQQLGPGASVDEVAIGWRSISIRNLRLPLDDHGSQLLIPDASAGVRPLDVVPAPREFGRALRSLSIHRAHLVVAAPSPPDVADRPEALLQFHVPVALYRALMRFDSVTSVQMDSSRVSYVKDGKEIAIARELSLNIQRVEHGRFTVSGSGQYLSDERATFSISGELSATNQTFNVAALLNLPPGSLSFADAHLGAVHTAGGSVSISVAASGESGSISATAAVSDFVVVTPQGDIRLPRVQLATAGDTLVLNRTTVESPFGQAKLAGRLLLGSGELDVQGLAEAWYADTAQIELALCGTVRQPMVNFRAGHIRFADQEFSGVRGELTYSSGELRATDVVFGHAYGRGHASGAFRLDSSHTWYAHGGFALDSAGSARYWRPRFSGFRWDVHGVGSRVSPRFAFVDRDGSLLAEVSGDQGEDSWTAELKDPAGNISAARLTVSGGDVQLSLQDGQVLLGALVNVPGGMLDAFTALSLAFEGNADSGSVTLRSVLAADSTQLLPQVLRDVAFEGGYRHRADGALTFNGQWSGTNGEGQPFHGLADLDLLEQVLTINRLFIDDAGAGNGTVDFAARNLQLEFDVNDVPFDRLPLVPAVARHMRLQGRATGVFNVFGEFAAPEWSVGLSIAEGAVFGVPGYWVNLGADGRGSRIDIERFEVGRDIRKIMSADGWLDVGGNQVAITAETGSASAEDFVLALSGRTGILSGLLDGRAAISGELTRPHVEVDCRVSNGLLLNEIHFTSLDLSGQIATLQDSLPVIRLSRLDLVESGRYACSGYAETGLKKGSPLSGHLQGGGDLLYMVDQLDRSFHSGGSFGGFSFDLGGSLDHPVLMSASLTLDHGRFAYRPATPGDVNVTISIRVGESGAVEHGVVDMRSGDQALTIRAGTAIAAANPGLRPIRIDGLGANLGVIELRTGTQGMPIRLPGLMKPEWTGQLMTGTEPREPIMLSLHTDSTLFITGQVEMRNGRITFPFVGTGGGPMRPVTQWIVDRLAEAYWSLDLYVGAGNHYDVEVTGLRDSDLFTGLRDSPVFSTLADYLDHLSIDAVIDPAMVPLRVRASIADTSFYLLGRLSSSNGRVEYLDQQFRIDYAYCDFDETNIMPVLEGRASTAGFDANGQRVPVYLTMYVIDRETQARQRRGRLDHLTFVLEDGAGSPPEEVLALLGYNIADVGGKAQQLVTSSVVRAIGRQWLDPIERRIERWTPLDEITITPVGGRSVSLARLQKQQAAQDQELRTNNSAIRYFTGSQLTVGKYLTNHMFVTYTGELSESETAPESGRLSLVHLWNLEYRIQPLSPDLVLDFAVEYDEFERRRDESVSLKYSFALEP